MKLTRRGLAVAVALLTAAGTLSACGSGGSDGKTIRVVYQKFGVGIQLDAHFQKIKKEFETANPGLKVTLVPVNASENDYYTKVSLMQKSASTAPDVVYEDSFLINSDIQAGYLRPLDDYLAKWSDWSQFLPAAQGAARGQDGKTYGVPTDTDTRGLWYNKQLFAKAGLPTDWQPKTWDDVLAAARTIKAKLAGVTPLNVFAGKPAGERSSMQGLEMLLYGTGGTLYDAKTKKWIAPSQGFTDSLAFMQTVYQQGLGPTPQQALDPNSSGVMSGQLMPAGKLAINLDGSWLSSTWLPSGARPWPQWSSVLGTAAMPTQHGQGPGKVSMSGGWTLAISAKSKASDTAFKFISTALNKEGALSYDLAGAAVPVRKDVAADPRYLSSNPTAKFWSALVGVTFYRPALPEYPRISNEIQVATETVITGQGSPAAAVNAYAASLKGIVGPSNVAGG
ncbi:extracellular solute-binding protein [Fodinicola feengrottensis]|uniref:Extracellular solute-binding protein n=1 Tax=Fodinicola feengrottensis TaxID=435914 RepID=A0ABN2GUL0_9ACTN